MERRHSGSEDLTKLTDDELEQATGGLFRFISAIVYSGTNTGDRRTGTNPQVWITSAT